ncbi:MAG: glutamine amidotransferase [Candidatus Daviesbacteria bacterium]|nr:glutamine amidotransferase [Candidatus Daviesbacteria bacterium]
MKLVIGYLYSDLMNIYGDTGNIIALQKRAEWRNIEVEIKYISVNDKLNKGDVDIYFFGGGQDLTQEQVAYDLQKSNKGKIIKSEVERGVPLLSICGGYQLLGEYYQPHNKPKLRGISLFPAYTVASNDRMIGNIVIKTQDSVILRSKTEESRSFAKAQDDNYLVGFENHSGKTYLKNEAKPFGKVIKGFGNNGEDHTEGCIYKNAIGCYMHGSLLPKNPELTDWLLTRALEVKYKKEVLLKPINDEIESKAHNKAIKKFS